MAKQFPMVYIVKGCEEIIENIDQHYYFQYLKKYQRILATYLKENIPFKEKRERMLALEDEGPHNIQAFIHKEIIK